MATWRCPHCGTPQVESARCWVCHRSTTSCASCRHFGRSVAAQLGFCVLDRRRTPLRGTEQRACWEERPAALAGAGRVAGAVDAAAAAFERPVYRLWEDGEA